MCNGNRKQRWSHRLHWPGRVSNPELQRWWFQYKKCAIHSTTTNLIKIKKMKKFRVLFSVGPVWENGISFASRIFVKKCGSHCIEIYLWQQAGSIHNNHIKAFDFALHPLNFTVICTINICLQSGAKKICNHCIVLITTGL